MAISARSPAPRVCSRVDREPCVIESRACPGGRRVTCPAGGWEQRRGVVRIRRSVVVGLVTAVAIGRRRRVVAIDMTIRAGYVYVCSREREWRVVVVEGRRLPRCRGVAKRAVHWESGRLVVRIGRGVVIVGMTA